MVPFGLVAGLVTGPVIGLLVSKSVLGLVIGLAGGLAGGLIFAGGTKLAVSLVDGIAGAVSLGAVEMRSVPNQGIHRSGRIALLAGLLPGLLGWLIFGTVFLSVAGPLVGMTLGSTVGLLVGAAFGMRVGGEAFLKHFLLRFSLLRADSAPLNYIHFLDFASERVLLRKVGGGYTFIHSLLMEHFAARRGNHEDRERQTAEYPPVGM
jgi:hypothetical protein